jgi:hypothetical protein
MEYKGRRLAQKDRLREIKQEYWKSKSKSVPRRMEKYTVFFIGKRDKMNVRRISTASYICKVLERMINMHIS